ncbi:tetratricopeptide repeat protein [Sphingomonas sp. LT1P40]|uniref:tetratricopeptide repeat protein n=1 Tax=Alteristakelama amylovorans TaxID=3096166 RepID=UPI002FC7C032
MRIFRLLAGVSAVLAATSAQPAMAGKRWHYGSASEAAYRQGDYARAFAAAEVELAKCEAVRPETDKCLDVMIWLSNVARMRDDSRSGEIYGRRAQALAERTLPAGHPDIAESMDTRAANLNVLGRRSEAERLNFTALAIYEKALPLGDRRTAASISSLLFKLNEQGRYADAEPLQRKELAIRERTLPPGDSEVTASTVNLAFNLLYQDRHADAEPFFRRALTLYERNPPAVSHFIATTIGGLASSLDAQGRYAEAEPLHRKALSMHERQLPTTHPDRATTMINLAVNLKAQNRRAEVESLYRRALAIYEQSLAIDDPYIGTAYNNLAIYLDEQGRYAEAEPLYRKALVSRSSLVLSHPDRIAGMWSFATYLHRRGSAPAEVRSFYRKAESGALERIRSFVGFTPASQAEVRKYRPIFTGAVRAAWDLAAERR